jgi:hypothetical protein
MAEKGRVDYDEVPAWSADKAAWSEEQRREYEKFPWVLRKCVDFVARHQGFGIWVQRRLIDWHNRSLDRSDRKFDRMYKKKEREEAKAERAKIAEMKEAGRQVRITRRENRKLFYLEQAERKREEKARRK